LPTTAEIAADWRKAAVSPLNWTDCANQAGAAQGEAGGFFVEATGFPRRAYMKPVHDHLDDQIVCRAAREKIAADLAYDLGLPVPPAQLTTWLEGKSSKPVVVSLVMYPTQFAWLQVRGLPIPQSVHGAALAAVLAKGSPMLAFDTWLSQEDHGDHPHNIVWGYEPANMANTGLIFLDYSFSMGYNGTWRSGGWKPVTLVPFPPLLLQYLDKQALRTTLEKIEAYPDAEIGAVIQRVPDSHMAPAQRDLLQEGLIGRKTLLRACLQQLL
jgi:hypothetical protein